MKDFSGSDIVNKMGWNQESIFELFLEFLSNNNLEDSWLDFLNNKAEEEMLESENYE